MRFRIQYVLGFPVWLPLIVGAGIFFTGHSLSARRIHTDRQPAHYKALHHRFPIDLKLV